jgi:hypothetical protein
MMRCSKCGAGLVQWSHADKWVVECHVCSIQWVVNSEELVEWEDAAKGSFTNREEL